jgi:hypothetical protein
MLHYDNLEDAKTKLVGTYAYYKDEAVLVKDIILMDNQKYGVKVLKLGARTSTVIFLHDPDFNFMKFNLGYSNHQHSSVWWYRIPAKQYRQGLKAEYVKRRATNQVYEIQTDFSFSKPIVNMLQNIYPSFEETQQALKDELVTIMAFHKDFALTYDRIHTDFIVEYKGVSIGCLNSPKEMKLMEPYQFVTEALKEAIA